MNPHRTIGFISLICLSERKGVPRHSTSREICAATTAGSDREQRASLDRGLT